MPSFDAISNTPISALSSSTSSVVAIVAHTTWNVLTHQVDAGPINTTWNVHATVAKTSSTTWNIHNNVDKGPQSASWNVRAVANKIASTTWNVRAVANKSASTTWDVAVISFTPARLSQITTEVLLQNNPNLAATNVVAEVLAADVSSFLVANIVAEVLASDISGYASSQIVVEALYDPGPVNILSTQVAAEVLIKYAQTALASTNLRGNSSLSAFGYRVIKNQAVLTDNTTVNAAGTILKIASAHLSSNANLNASGLVTHKSTANLSASSHLNVAGGITHKSGAYLFDTSSVNVDGTIVKNASANLSGHSTIAVDAIVTTNSSDQNISPVGIFSGESFGTPQIYQQAIEKKFIPSQNNLVGTYAAGLAPGIRNPYVKAGIIYGKYLFEEIKVGKNVKVAINSLDKKNAKKRTPILSLESLQGSINGKIYDIQEQRRNLQVPA